VEADDSYWRRPPDDRNAAPAPASDPGPASEGPRYESQTYQSQTYQSQTYQSQTYHGQMYEGQTYQGPPTTTPPPTGWRPARLVEPPPPRRLPAQDHAHIDDEEARARTLTRGVGLVVAAILVIVACVLCGRAVATGSYSPVQTMWAPVSPVLNT
jgi:hypothetical protein